MVVAWIFARDHIVIVSGGRLEIINNSYPDVGHFLHIDSLDMDYSSGTVI